MNVSKTLTLVITALVGFALSLILVFHFILENRLQNDPAPLAANIGALYKPKATNTDLPVSSVGRPVRLKIPKINVDAAVEHVRLAPDGAMDVPKDMNNVAWFELGQRPGENGSAVIDGHYGWKHGKPSAFDDLYKLRKGDELYIEDETGATTAFVVRESQRYDPKANTSGIFGSSDGKAHLNLITCEGTWGKIKKSYSKRLVVFADKE